MISPIRSIADLNKKSVSGNLLIRGLICNRVNRRYAISENLEVDISQYRLS
jgi:hypothetical protein